MSDQTHPDRDALAGLVVGVPAARRATETAKLIERWGGTPLVGPTVEEVPVEDESEVLDATREVVHRRPRWSVHLTGVGTKRWFQAAERAGLLEPLLASLKEAELVARGQKTQAALKFYGLGAAWMPEGETSREIAEWLTPQLNAGEVVAVQRHGEPVAGLASALEGAGARLIELVTYRWEIPSDGEPAVQLIRALIAGDSHALLVTSAPQVRNLFAIAGRLGVSEELQAALAKRVYLAAVGEVAASGLEREGLKADLVASPPRLGALVRALAASRSAIAEKAAEAAR